MPGDIVLLNPTSGEAESFDPQSANEALGKGFHIPLNDDQGQPVSASFDEARELVKQGTHSQPTPEQLQYLLDKKEFNSPIQQIGAFTEGMLEPNTFGAYGKLASAMGLTDEESILKRQEFNPGLHALGEAAGTVAGIALAPETSLPGLITKAGTAAQKAIAAKGLGKVSQLAIQGAVEGALYTAQHEVSERLLGDPSATAENMLSDIGLSAALGGGLGLAFSPVSIGIDKAINSGRGFVGRGATAKSIGNKAIPMTEMLPSMGIPEAERAGIVDGMRQLRDNVGELDEAVKDLGLPDIDAFRSASPFVKKMYAGGVRNPTWVGAGLAGDLQQGYKTIEGVVDNALGADIGLTKADAGRALKESIVSKVDSEYQPIKQIFSEMKDAGSIVPLEENAVKSLSKDVGNIESLMVREGVPLSKNSAGYKLSQRVSEEVKNLRTVDELQRYRTQLGQDIPIASQQEKHVLGEIRNKIDDTIELSIIKEAKNIPEGSPLKARFDQLLIDNTLSKEAYGVLKTKIQDLGKGLGKNFKGGQGVQAFKDWLEETAPEVVADKLFTKNNSEFLSFFKQSFPEESKLLASLKKSQLRDKALEGGIVDPSTVLKEIDKLEPEAKEFLFSADELKNLKQSALWVDVAKEVSKGFNPSETAGAMSWLDLFNPLKFHEFVGKNTGDLIKKHVINQLVRSSPGDAPMIMAITNMANFAAKTRDRVERYSGGIFGKAAQTMIESNRKKEEEGMLPASTPVKMNKIGTMVKAYSNSPGSLIEHLANNTGQVSGYAPDSINSFSASVGTAVSFLASKVPEEVKASPLDAPSVPSNDKIEKFNRYAEVVDNPISVLAKVKSGNLLPQDIETLTVVYPQLYSQMQQSVYGKLIDFTSKHDVSEIPYKTKLGLSMFLGQNLDSTMSPQGIINNQQVLAVSQAQKEAMDVQRMTQPSKTGMGRMKIPQLDQTKAQSALTMA